MSDNLIQVRGTDGSVYTIDEYNHTVTSADGKRADFRDVAIGDMGTRDLSVASVHQNAVLAGFLVDYGLQSDSVADIVCPPLPVTKASDTYYTVSENDRFRRVDTYLASESAPINEIGPTLSTDTYTTKPYGLATFVSQGVEANADVPVNPRLLSLKRVMNAMVIEREARAVAALQNATTFTGFTTSKTSSNFWDTIGGAPTASDPVADLIAAMESMLLPCTHVVMSEKAWNRLVFNPNTAKYGLYSTEKAVSVSRNPAELAERLGFRGVQFIIGRMKAESTTQGTTTKGYLWDDDVTLLHIPSDASINGESVPTARTFRWLKDGAARESMGYRIREWDTPGRGQDGGRNIAVVCNEVIKVVAPATGHIIINVF